MVRYGCSKIVLKRLMLITAVLGVLLNREPQILNGSIPGDWSLDVIRGMLTFGVLVGAFKVWKTLHR